MPKDKRVETVAWDDDVWADVDEAPAEATSAREPVPSAMPPTPPEPETARMVPPTAAPAAVPSVEPKPSQPELGHPPAVSLVKTPAVSLPDANQRPERVPAAGPSVPKVEPPPLPVARKATEPTAPAVGQPPPLPKAAAFLPRPVATSLAATKAPVQPPPVLERTVAAKAPAANPPPPKVPPRKKPLAAIFTQGMAREALVAEENASSAQKGTIVNHPKLGPAFARQEKPPEEA